MMHVRELDKWGAGYFNASRDGGKRSHDGIDLISKVGEPIFSPVDGVVTKIGYPYSHHPDYRYVEISSKEYRYRLFYVHPVIAIGDVVQQGQIIGLAQDLNIIYKGITDHIHFEIKNKQGGYIDPTPVVIALESAGKSIT